METLDSLSKSLKTSKSIKTVVSTMKALAASNIKRYEKAAKSLIHYTQNVQLGIHGILSQDPEIAKELSRVSGNKIVIIIFGSNQGLCGRFNDRILEFTNNYLKDNNIDREDCLFCSVGDRLATHLENHKINSNAHFSVPNSLEGIVESVHQLILTLDDFRSKNKVGRIFLFYTHYEGGTTGIQKRMQLLPIKEQIIQNIENEKWPSKKIPIWKVSTQDLIPELIEHFLFSSLYHSLTMSLASEQANRLITLQTAETNIKDFIEETTRQYNQQRQAVITSELLDVVSGYQVSKKKKAE